MGQYLMRLIEGSGDFENFSYHLIEAEDEQMVKYHYHYTLKKWGYAPASWGGKHALDNWDMGFAELDLITELTDVEHYVLDKYLTGWHKAAEE